MLFKALAQLLKETIENTGLKFDILNESSLIYNYVDKESGHKSSAKYCMYIVKQFIND